MKKISKAFLVTWGLMPSFYAIGHKSGTGNIFEALDNNPYLMLFAFIGIYYYFSKVIKLGTQTGLIQKLISIVFALGTWLATVYESDVQTINKVLVGNVVGVFYSLLYIVAWYLIIESLQQVLTYIYENKHFDFQSSSQNKLINWFKSRPFLAPFLMLFVPWTIVALTAFPAVFMGDSLDQVMQFLGYADKTAAHPVLSTIFIGSCVQIGLWMGSANFGVFIYTVIQIGILSVCISYCLMILAKKTGNTTYVAIISILMAILPSIQGTILLATKDIVYTGFFCIFMTTLYMYFIDRHAFFNKKLVWLYITSIILMMLFRYNTLHFLVVTLIVYMISAFFLKRSLLSLTSIVPITILSLIIALFMNTVLVNNFVEAQPKPNRREMLSVPFQQTARFIRYHEDEVTNDDKDIINNVLNYNKIKEEYNPYLSDPVKRTHNEEASKQEMSDYFGLVGRQIKAHPLLAFESLAVSHSNLFNLNLSENSYYDTSLIVGGERDSQLNAIKSIGFKENSVSMTLNQLRVKLYRLWDRLPVLSQINNYGSYILLLFAMFALFLKHKQFFKAGALLPIFVFLGTLLAGPVTIGYIRYILPIILSVMILFGFFICDRKTVSK